MVRSWLHSTLGDKAAAAADELVRRVRQSEVAGAIEYMLHPSRGIAWGGPFNGQRFRLVLFHCLIEKLAPAVILETGTYLGTTTELLASTGLPVFSVESDPRHYGFVCARFWRTRNIHLLRADSRQALRAWLNGPLRELSNSIIFAYLDAHGGEDLPLAEELRILFGACPKAVVMIDDFQVPFDQGYRYDKYGVGRSLTADYIKSIAASRSLIAFYPSTPSSQETGARRGCVVLAGDANASALTALPLLQQA